jgi:hypothetical protein
MTWPLDAARLPGIRAAEDHPGRVMLPVAM